MLLILLKLVHVLVCLFLVVVVLLQSGKAADLAGAFGGMGSQTAFGPRGAATVLSKATTVAAVLFMLTSLTLSIVATRETGGVTSVLEREKGPAKTQPAQPAKPTVTFTPEGGGPSKTVPLEIPANPNQPAPAAPKK